MSETKTTHEFKDVKTKLIVITAETNLLKAIPINPDTIVDMIVTIIERKDEMMQ